MGGVNNISPETPLPEKQPLGPEKLETPQPVEQAEKVETLQPKKQEEAPLPTGKKAVSNKDDVVSKEKTQTRKKIEAIMQEDVRELYQSMNAEEQEKFRDKGMEVGNKIEILITTFKAKARNLLKLLMGWLLLVPKANKYYLEQEAKKKTEELIELALEEKQKNKLKK